jgi:hypothetical protein
MQKLPDNLATTDEIVSEEMEKLINEASNQKLIEFLQAGNQLIAERENGDVELAVNSAGQLCYIENRSLKLIQNLKKMRLSKKSKIDLGQYLKYQERLSPEISERVTMTSLAAAIAANHINEPKRLNKKQESYNLVIGYLYDNRKTTADNARKIYIQLTNHMYTKECSFYLASGRYDVISAEMELPSDLELAKEIRGEIEKNQELIMRFETSKTPGKCLLIVKRPKKT